LDFKLENVLVSLHSLKSMGLRPFGASASLFLRNGELLGHSPILNSLDKLERPAPFQSEEQTEFTGDVVFQPVQQQLIR
jgi:FtsZ-interacting cell division protein ZipA